MFIAVRPGMGRLSRKLPHSRIVGVDLSSKNELTNSVSALVKSRRLGLVHTSRKFSNHPGKELLESVGTSVDQNREQHQHGPHLNPRNPAARLQERHFPTTIGRTPADRPMQMDCHVCSKRRGRGDPQRYL